MAGKRLFDDPSGSPSAPLELISILPPSAFRSTFCVRRSASPLPVRIQRIPCAIALVLAAVVGAPERASAQNQATTFTMTTGGVTRALVGTSVGASGTITNSTPTGGSNLAIALSSGGVLSVTNLGSGTNSVAPQASTAVSGSIQTGILAGSRTWSVINTDTNAITTTSTASGSLQVVDQRVFGVSTGTIALGRYLRTSTPTTGTTNVTSTGVYSTTASGSLGNFSNSTSNGLTLTLNSGSANFAGTTANQTAGYQLGGTVQDFAAGVLSGSFTSNVTAEFGSIRPVVVNYTGTAVNQRVFNVTTGTIALGPVHQGPTVSGPSLVVTSTGRNASTANGTLGSFTGGPAGYSLGLASGSAQFYGATSSQTATYSIAGTASTLGSVSGTYTSAVTAEFGSIPNITVAVTGQVYSGQSTWNTNSGGNWGTITGTGANAFGLNWGANQGSPGLDPSYTNTDTATFGSALTSGTAVVNTNGANISLKAITFDNADGHYAIYQTNGSSFISMVGSGTSASAINVVAGDHAIHADITMNSSLNVDIGDNSSLTFHDALSGGSSFSLTKTGAGTLFFDSNSNYAGNTEIRGGLVSLLAGTTPLGSGTVNIYSGGTLDLNTRTLANTINVFDGGHLIDTGSSTATNIYGTTTFSGTTDGTINIAQGGYGDFQGVVNHAYVTISSGGTATFQNTVTEYGTVSVLSGGQATVSGTAEGVFSVSGSASFGSLVTGDIEVNNGGYVAFNGSNVAGSPLNVASGGVASVGSTATIGGLLEVSGSATIAGTVTSDADVIVQAGGRVRLVDTAVFQQGNLINNGTLIVDRSNTADLTLDTIISGTGGFTKLGLGTLTLSGNSSYTGATAVNAGKLLVNGQLGNTAVAVNASGLLGGSGTILGDVTVASSGTLSPGNSPGVLTLGSLSLSDGSHTLMEITGSTASLYDQIVGTGSGGLTFGGNLDLVISGSYADQTTFHLFSNFSSPSIGDFAVVVLDATGGEYTGLTFTGTDGVWTSTWTANHQRLVFSTTTGDLVVVPEPSACAMALAGLAYGGWQMFRRRRLRQAAPARR